MIRMRVLRLCDFPEAKELENENAVVNYGLAITNIIPQSIELEKQKNEIIIFSGGFRKLFKETVKGFKVYRARIPRAANLLFGIGLLLSIKKIEKENGKIDLIVIHNPLTGAGIWPLKRILKKPIAVYVHGTFTIRNQYEHFMSKMALKSADAIISISPPTTSQIGSMDEKFLKKTFMIRNGVDTNLFMPVGAQKEKVIFLGRDVPQKNLSTFLKASEIVKKKFPNTKIGIIGAKINDKRIDFSKIIPQESLPREISRSIIVMPYFQNTFGKTTPEAMACECYIIGTNTDIPKEVMHVGDFYDAKKAADHAFLANRIILALKKNRAELGKKARRLAEEKYSWKRNVEKLLGIFEKIIADKGKHP